MNRYLNLLVLFIATPVLAQVPEPWPAPSSSELTSATADMCRLQSKSILAADKLRRDGKSRDEVLALVPAEPQDVPAAKRVRLLEVTRENVEDVFDFRDLGPYTLYMFRWNVCARELLTVTRMARAATVHPQLAACQSRYSETQQCLQDLVLNVLKARD